MTKKAFIALVTISLLVTSILVEMQVGEVVDANPVPFPATPNTELPTLTIQTPESQSSLYSNNSMAMSFTVVQPDSWLSYYNGFFHYVGTCNLYVYLDGSLKQGFPWTKVKVNDYTLEFDNLSSNQHTIRIDGYCLAPSQIGTYQSNVTQTVTFTVIANSQTISFSANPALTIRGPYPSPTPTASPTPEPTEDPSSTSSQENIPTHTVSPTNTPPQNPTPNPSTNLSDKPTPTTIPTLTPIGIVEKDTDAVPASEIAIVVMAVLGICLAVAIVLQRKNVSRDNP
jgi:hypothetical protein